VVCELARALGLVAQFVKVNEDGKCSWVVGPGRRGTQIAESV